MILTGGLYLEDKACSFDTFKIDLNSFKIKDLRAEMKQQRMNHTMIYIEEAHTILAVAGENENK